MGLEDSAHPIPRPAASNPVLLHPVRVQARVLQVEAQANGAVLQPGQRLRVFPPDQVIHAIGLHDLAVSTAEAGDRLAEGERCLEPFLTRFAS